METSYFGFPSWLYSQCSLVIFAFFAIWDWFFFSALFFFSFVKFINIFPFFSSIIVELVVKSFVGNVQVKRARYQILVLKKKSESVMSAMRKVISKSSLAESWFNNSLFSWLGQYFIWIHCILLALPNNESSKFQGKYPYLIWEMLYNVLDKVSISINCIKISVGTPVKIDDQSAKLRISIAKFQNFPGYFIFLKRS